jgi:hypothetical protein
MAIQQIAALLVSISFAAGVNVYATVATLGLLARLGLVTLPGSLDPMASWWVISISALLFLLEFFADKIPYVDLIWNALQTFVRVPVGAFMAWAATTGLSPEWQLAATATGGLITFVAHGGKLAIRAAVTPSPEPVSNIVLSLSEDAFTIVLTWFATRHPFIAAAIVMALIVVAVVLIRWVVRAIGAFFRYARA